MFYLHLTDWLANSPTNKGTFPLSRTNSEKERDLIDERGTLWLLFLPLLIVVLTTLNMHHRADSLNDFFFFFFLTNPSRFPVASREVRQEEEGWI